MAVPAVSVGQNPKATAARFAAALAEANRRLNDDYEWYSDVRAKFGGM